jgi:serine/threonine protein kinase
MGACDAVSGLLERLKAALSESYAIQRELGHGGMAVVYLASDLKHDRPVALKVLRPELAASLGVERFLREIQIAARLNHPNILPLHDSGEAEGLPYYVMPFIAGESLRGRLERERQLPIADALRITGEICDALGYQAGERAVPGRACRRR